MNSRNFSDNENVERKFPQFPHCASRNRLSHESLIRFNSKVSFCFQVGHLFTRLTQNNCGRLKDLLCTMLQKISKCEVKARLYWNLIILPPLRFCVKSHFGKFQRSKNVIFGNFRDAELWILVNLGLESCSNLLKIKIQNL